MRWNTRTGIIETSSIEKQRERREDSKIKREREGEGWKEDGERVKGRESECVLNKCEEIIFTDTWHRYNIYS